MYTLAAPFGVTASTVKMRFQSPEDEQLYLDLVKKLQGVTVGPVGGFGPFNVFPSGVAQDLAGRAVVAAGQVKAAVRKEVAKGVAPYLIGAGLLGLTGAILGGIAYARSRR
jgi:hypothetical protein